ncbi:MAG: type II toxin-antitoxin system VapC family toxin [Deltaproteobacteria bacterium]|nr:type II toxin-antitoxin system VapC family toxin [Deltaproteobacteria bacterium]
MAKRYLFDTDILIAYLRGYAQTVELLKTLAAQGFDFCISPATIVEIEAGTRDAEKEKTYELLDMFEVYVVDRSIAHLAGASLRKYRKKGITLGLADVMIAATALTHHLTLVTYNISHYPMSELQILSPLSSPKVFK